MYGCLLRSRLLLPKLYCELQEQSNAFHISQPKRCAGKADPTGLRFILATGDLVLFWSEYVVDSGLAKMYHSQKYYAFSLITSAQKPKLEHEYYIDSSHIEVKIFPA